MVGERTERTIPRLTNARRWTGPPAGKRKMVRAGGSASRTINDSDTPDPGGGHHPAWKRPKDDTHRPRWTPYTQRFPALGSLTPAEKNRRVRTIPDRDSVVVEQNSLDPIWHAERDGSHRAPLGRNVSVPRRGMRPVGIGGPAQWVAPVRDNGRPMAGNMDWNPSEHAVPEEDQTSRPMEGVTSPEPLGHSAMKLHLDNQPSSNKLKPERSEHPALDDIPRRVVGFYDNQTLWWIRIQMGMVIQCRCRHRRSLQSIRRQWNIASGRGPYFCIPPRCNVGDDAGVDSVRIHYGMGGVCWIFS